MKKKDNKTAKFFRKLVYSNRVVTVLCLLLLQLLYLAIFCFSIYKNNYYINAISVVLQLIFALTIISTERNSAYKMGWVLLVFILPIFGCLFYLIYGLNVSNKRLRNNIETAFLQNDKMQTKLNVLQKLTNEQEFYKSFCDYLNKQGYPAFDNTNVNFFSSGESLFDDVLQNLALAQKQIFIETFILEEGLLWDKMLSIIQAKAQQGVQVKIIYDDMGSIAKVKKNYYKKLCEINGVECVKFNKVTPFLFKSINNRDHRKIIVVDGVAYMGGANIADEYANIKTKYGYWLDHGIKLCGEGANGIISMFIDIWNAFSQNKLDKTCLIAEQINTGGIVQPFATNPFNKTDIAYNVYLDIINRADRYLYISTPYFIPDNTLIQALKHASQRGVDVRILVPKIPDKKIPYRLTKANFAPLIKEGVKFYYYTSGFNHAKTLISDDQIAVVGTINLDYVSMFLNFECGVLLYKNTCLTEIANHFTQVFNASSLIGEQDAKRTLIGRFVDKVLVTIEMLF